MGFVVDKVALGQVFSKYLGLPRQFSFPQVLYNHLSSGAGTIGQLVVDLPSGISLNPPQETKKIKSHVYNSHYGLHLFKIIKLRLKGKANPVTGREGP
jgi:hypothetical protein